MTRHTFGSVKRTIVDAVVVQINDQREPCCNLSFPLTAVEAFSKCDQARRQRSETAPRWPSRSPDRDPPERTFTDWWPFKENQGALLGNIQE